MGAVVQLLRPDMTVLASVYTNSKGRFSFSTVLPGHYAVKAMGTSFLPSMRENVRVHATTVVNLTLNTLYEVTKWLPAEPRAGNAQKDDWAWTLRSSANRPLLRWLEDGPLLVVSDGPGTTPKLKARLVASGQQGTFGENGQRITVEMEDTPSDSRELLARVDFEPGSDGGMESMLGFRQELGYAGSVQSLAAVAIHPEIESGDSEGLDEAAIRTWETMNLGDEFQAEVGADQVLAQFAHGTQGTVVAALPFVTVGWRGDNSTVHYRMATSVPAAQRQEESQASAWLPALSTRNGSLVLEHGLHQEIGWERKTDVSGLSLVVFADSIESPVLEAMSRESTSGDGQVSRNTLFDSGSGMMRVAGPGFSTTGVSAAFERSFSGGNHLRVTYANGDALVVPAAQHVATLSQIVASARPRHAQMYSISLSGTLDGTGTRWRASYRWQPEDTLTPIAPFALDGAEPFLNLHLRQPICHPHEGARRVDAMIDVRNLLAEGYRPYLLSDGSMVLFAQDQRSMSAGLAFTF